MEEGLRNLCISKVRRCASLVIRSALGSIPQESPYIILTSYRGIREERSLVVLGESGHMKIDQSITTTTTRWIIDHYIQDPLMKS